MYGKRVLPKAKRLLSSSVALYMLEMTVNLRNNFQKSPMMLNLSHKRVRFQHGDNEEISCYSLAHEE